MIYFLAIAGFIAGIVIYLYFLTILGQGSSKKVKTENNMQTNSESSKTNKNSGMKPRICPVCKSILTENDSLYAEMYKHPDDPNKAKVFIHGCRYCYRPSGKKPEGGLNISEYKKDAISNGK